MTMNMTRTVVALVVVATIVLVVFLEKWWLSSSCFLVLLLLSLQLYLITRVFQCSQKRLKDYSKTYELFSPVRASDALTNMRILPLPLGFLEISVLSEFYGSSADA